MAIADTALITEHTRAWVERAVIGLNLCPFAKAVQTKQQVRYVVTEARDTEALQTALIDELRWLAQADAQLVDTTLLIHPHVLQVFADYNDFLDRADEALLQTGLDGVLQVASFHPRYQFAGTDEHDIGNATNRSPYPTLHLLREASLDRAVAAFPNPEAIFETNIATLRAIGPSGWTDLQQQCLRDAQDILRGRMT